MSETWDSNEKQGIIRSLTSTLMGRGLLANWSGFSFRNRRNMFEALGYDRVLTPQMQRWRYERGGICARLVEQKPIATWRGGGELVEDEDPDTNTLFEQAWHDLNVKLKIWPTLERTDILAGLGRYAVMLIGGPGDIGTPLTRMTADQFAYLQPFSERDAQVISLDIDSTSSRFGQPVLYSFKRLTAPLEGIASSLAKQVHWSRVIHIADGKLDDNIYGQPRLERVWNLMDDLDKVVGGGTEAFWKRVDAGMQMKFDPAIAPMSPEDKVKFDEQLEEYTHGLRRILRTRGIDINEMGSSVAGIKDPAMTVISLISAATSIPQRILLGSERGELASSQDRDEWAERINDRRLSFAGPEVVLPLVDRLISFGTLPTPDKYEVRWPSVKALDDEQKVELGKNVATINQLMGETVVTADEIRDRYLDLPPLEEVMSPEDIEAAKLDSTAPPVPPAEPGQPGKPGVPTQKATKLKAAARRRAKWAVLTTAEKKTYWDRYNARIGKGKPWKNIHQAADRFPRRSA